MTEDADLATGNEQSFADTTAEELPPADRDRIFEVVKQRAPGFAGYQAATSRVIPVFEITLT